MAPSQRNYFAVLEDSEEREKELSHKPVIKDSKEFAAAEKQYSKQELSQLSKDDYTNKDFKYKGIYIEGSDIGLFKAPCPLRSSIIDFFFTYLSDTYFNGARAEDAVFVTPFASQHVIACLDETEQVEETLMPFNLWHKNLIIFMVIDNGGDRGVATINHFSLLVYWRKFNVFVHHDSIQGVNSWAAERLFDAVKGFVVTDDDEERNSTNKSRKGAVTQRRSKRSNSSTKKKKKNSKSSSSSEPRLVEAYTPQQINYCDCGVYVMAIARAICEWYVSDSEDKGDYWFQAMEKSVNPSIESTMRSEILQLILDLAISSPRT